MLGFQNDRVSFIGSLITYGGLAQLARALDLHSRGHRFDSDILHNSIEYFKVKKRLLSKHLSPYMLCSICLTRKTFIDILKRYKKYQPIFLQ